jgi:hypothetical protein
LKIKKGERSTLSLFFYKKGGDKMVKDRLGRKILNEGEEIEGGFSDAFASSAWRLVWWEGSKYLERSGGFYYLRWEISNGGPYNFYISQMSKEQVGKFLAKKGWDDEDIEKILKEYKE